MDYVSSAREELEERYFLILGSGEAYRFRTHWGAKRWAKAHKVSGYIARELGIIGECHIEIMGE